MQIDFIGLSTQAEYHGVLGNPNKVLHSDMLSQFSILTD